MSLLEALHLAPWIVAGLYAAWKLPDWIGKWLDLRDRLKSSNS